MLLSSSSTERKPITTFVTHLGKAPNAIATAASVTPCVFAKAIHCETFSWCSGLGANRGYLHQVKTNLEKLRRSPAAAVLATILSTEFVCASKCR